MFTPNQYYKGDGIYDGVSYEIETSRQGDSYYVGISCVNRRGTNTTETSGSFLIDNEDMVLFGTHSKFIHFVVTETLIGG